MSRWLSFLQIRPGETKMVFLLAALFALIEIGRGLGGNAADGLFFVRFGVDNLPYMYMILGAVTFVVMLVYTAGLGRFDKGAFFVALLLILALVLVIERAAVLLGLALLYPVVWVTVNVVNQVLGTLTWTAATEVCDARQAKRLFSLFTSAGILGGVVGNFVTGPLANFIGTENLLAVFGVLLLFCLLITRAITRGFFRGSRSSDKHALPAETTTSLIKEIRIGFDFVRVTPLMQLLAIASVLFSVLYFSIAFPFSRVVSASFPSDAQVAGFLGTFNGVTTVVTFLVSLLLANRLYSRIGVVNSVLLLPLTYLGGFILFAAYYSLNAGIVARFAQLLVLGGIAGSAYATFYNVVPPEKRGQVQSFDAGVTSQLGIMLSGLLLLVGNQFLTPTEIFILGMVVALVNIFLIWRMHKAYGDALVAALRAGFLDVFTATTRGFQHLGRDSHAIQVSIAHLQDAKPTVRRIAAQVLGRMNAREAIEPLTRTLNDDDAGVRSAALGALVALDARETENAICARLDDAVPMVRSAAIDALTKLAPQSTESFLHATRDAEPNVRARAAVALFGAGETTRAEAVINALLNADADAERIAGLNALAQTHAQADEKFVARMLTSPSPSVRVAAAQALGVFENAESFSALALALDDPDTRVRQSAAHALESCTDALDSIIPVLNSDSSRAQQAALEALRGFGAAAHKPVSEWARAQIPRAQQLRVWNNALHHSDDVKNSRAGNFLHSLLHQRELETEQRILQALALLGAEEQLALVAKGLRSRSPELRAQALEALDTLADKHVARGLIPLLEDSEADAGKQDARAVLQTLTTQPDRWMRALAVYTMGELLARDLQTLVTRAEEDAAVIVRQAAARFVVDGKGGGRMPETLQTLGTIERVLFLRQVPLFGNLAPEDLEQIAETASERVFENNAHLCREGEVGDEMFVIVEGQVRIEKQTNGMSKRIRSMEAGAHIGELALLREQPRSADVIAEGGSVRTLVLSGDAVRSILHDRPEVAMAMLASLAERLSTMG